MNINEYLSSKLEKILSEQALTGFSIEKSITLKDDQFLYFRFKNEDAKTTTRIDFIGCLYRIENNQVNVTYYVIGFDRVQTNDSKPVEKYKLYQSDLSVSEGFIVVGDKYIILGLINSNLFESQFKQLYYKT